MEASNRKQDIQKLYHQNLFNRYYAYKNVNLTFGQTYGLKVLIGAFSLLFKLALSRLFRQEKSALGSIFISWSPLHTKRAKDLNESYRLIEVNTLSFSKEQLQHFAAISIREFIQHLSTMRKSHVAKFENSSLYLRDSLPYRTWFAIEFLALKGIVPRADRVFVAGHGDRQTLIISKLCEKHKIEFSMLQHGVLGKKERWMHLKADCFYYLYPFSKPYVKHLLKVTTDTKLQYLPKKESSLKLKVFDRGRFERNLAYATSPANPEKDIEIIQALQQDMPPDKYNLLIYPHPLEKLATYSHFKEKYSAFVSRERHKNVEYIISRYSTLGIEYYEQGIVPVFLNYENHQMDFLEENSFLVFDNPIDFKEWLKTL